MLQHTWLQEILSPYSTLLSLVSPKTCSKQNKTMFYPIKHFSGIVATPVGLSPHPFGVSATPLLYFVVTKCKGGFFIRLC